MKRFCLIMFILLLPAGIAATEDEVYLDLGTPSLQNFNTGKFSYENDPLEKEDIDDEDYLKPSFGTIKKLFKEDFLQDRKPGKIKRDK